MEIKPMRANIPNDWFARYKKLCHEFMTTLSDCIEEIALINLSQEEFIDLMNQKVKELNLKNYIKGLEDERVEKENKINSLTDAKYNDGLRKQLTNQIESLKNKEEDSAKKTKKAASKESASGDNKDESLADGLF